VATGAFMADMVHSALRRKLAAAQAVGDVQRINILRGMMTAGAAKEVPVEVEVPEEDVKEPKEQWHFLEQSIAADGRRETWIDGEIAPRGDEE
jgi:hypothetical protein